jgi:hypothetical protein
MIALSLPTCRPAPPEMAIHPYNPLILQEFYDILSPIDLTMERRPNQHRPETTQNQPPREAGEGSPSLPINRQEQLKFQHDRAEGNPLVSPIEQIEQKFEVTEREKKLLQVMARVIAVGYIPSILGERRKEIAIEETLLNYIDKFTSTPPNTENHLSE